MRTMSTQMGTTGSDGGPEGLSEVQESLLEHAAPEAEKEELAGNVGAVKQNCFDGAVLVDVTPAAEQIVRAARECFGYIRESLLERSRSAAVSGGQ